jgi:hypothetical protein
VTSTDLFNHPDMDKKVDAEAAASALGEIFQALGSPGGGQASNVFSSVPSTDTPAAPTDTTAPSGTAATGDRASPVPEGTGVSQPFGVGNAHEGSHPGIDFAVPLDTQLLAAASGRVTNAGNNDPGGYGNMVEITTPDGVAIRYGHLHGMNVKVGDQIHAGQIIGTSGGEQGGAGAGNSTGAHLHFEVDVNGQPVDPTPFLAGGYTLVGGPASSTTPATADPKTIAATALRNVMHAIKGEALEGDPAAQATQTPGTGSTDDTDPGAIDSFLAATRQHESGGDYTIRNQSGLSNASGAYQFIGTTWKSAGGSTASAADASPAEQDAVARKMALNLFEKYHSWRLVAIAWYGGPGVADQVAAGKDPGAPDQQGGYLAYGDTIARMMSGGK